MVRIHRSRPTLVVSLAMAWALGGVRCVSAAPPVELNPDRAHVAIFTAPAGPDVRLYDASLSEWAIDPSLPMETG